MMTDIEERVVNIDKRQESFETFVKAYIQKTDERMARQEEDMKAFQAKHDADMKKIDEKFDKIDEKFDQVNAKIDGLGKFVQSLTITAMVGVGASVAAALAIAYTAITTLANSVK